jgi:CRISPR/Cas system-associated endonuclease Cas1
MEVEMFDTLRYSKILEAVGVSREQAEAHIKIIAEVVETDLATKQDLRELEYRLVIKNAAAVATIVGLALAIMAFILKN